MSDREDHVTGAPHPRRSIFPGLLLIVIGLIFLLHRFDPAIAIGHIARVYWPLLFIVWGVAKLIDHFSAQRTGQARAPLLSGGEAALLILLSAVLLAFGMHDWLHERFPNLEMEFGPSPGYSQSRELSPQAIPAGSHVAIESGRGNITVHGSGGNDLRVSVNESASGESESAADDRMKRVAVVIEQTSSGYLVHPLHQSDSRGEVSVDLNVELPKSSSVALHTSRGDINASSIAGAIEARTEVGDITIHGAGSDVAARLEKGDARITEVAGDLTLLGRGEDAEIADVAGNATLDGPFTGSTIVRKVGKTTQISSPWATLTIAQLAGKLELDSDEIKLSDAAGMAKIRAHDKDVAIENVTGQVEIVDSRGTVKLAYSAPPREPLNVTNDSGDVDVTLPSKSSFQITAFSRSGKVDSDFEDPSLRMAGESGNGQLDGQFGGRSGMPMPKITITTSYGTISLRKSS